MKVFISGSRSIRKLTEQMQDLLQSIIDNGDEVLIGDCEGIDDTCQRFFKDHGYGKVTVYVAGVLCPARYNVGFEEKHLAIDPYIMPCSREFYAVKDIAMTRDADYGIAIWDGKSSGTLNNINRMDKMGKPMKIIKYPLG